jgi:hypothetical protein
LNRHLDVPLICIRVLREEEELMKLVAHPLVVAAALGLLGPVALEQDIEDEATPIKGDTSDVLASMTLDSEPAMQRPTVSVVVAENPGDSSVCFDDPVVS